jgi:hypothetical protein
MIFNICIAAIIAKRTILKKVTKSLGARARLSLDNVCNRVDT